MFKKKVKINYLTKDIERSNQGDHIYTKFVSIVVEGKSTKRYHNSLGIIMRLSRSARVLIDFLVERMDSRNQVVNDAYLKRDFNSLLREIGQPEYSSVTINRAFTELVEADLILKKKKRGVYQINPLFFFNGPDAKREKIIRSYLEAPVKKAATESRRKYFMEKEKEKEKED